MNETEIDVTVERLMGWVDHYLHCELDHEYGRARPQTARQLLQAAIREELLQTRAAALLHEEVQ